MTAPAIVLNSRWALGDTVVLTALARDLRRAHPGLRLGVAGNYLSLWRHNPHVAALGGAERAAARVVRAEYQDGIRAVNDGRVRRHFLAWFHEDFERQTGLRVPVTEPRGEVYLTAQERRPRVGGRYWLVVAGGKEDMTAKVWAPQRWQELVDRAGRLGLVCAQAGGTCRGHFQPRLRGVVDLVGATPDVRDFCGLVANCEGVVCGVSAAMHLAAVFEKPCVVIAGGRERWEWECYANVAATFGPHCAPVRVPHRYLHTIGLLDCCRDRGCWKKRTLAAAERGECPQKRQELCLRPLRDGAGAALPECLGLITVDHVLEAVMSYYEDGTLPPIGRPAGTYSLAAPPTPPAARATAPAPPRPAPGPHDALDHPDVGGKFTVCVLCYGDHEKLARRCLGGVLDSLPAERRDLRVAANQVSAGTRAYLDALAAGGQVAKVYYDDGDRRKYPAMRALCHDPQLPLATKYLVWLDDDAWVVDRLWAVHLAQAVGREHRLGGRLYGAKRVHDLAAHARGGHRPEQWFQTASWYRGRDLCVRDREATAANGSCVYFAAGWFWALDVATLRGADVPDVRLRHNGGDIAVGAAVHQAGGRIIDFNAGKKYVCCPPKNAGGRRGWSEAFPWADPTTRARHIPGT